MSSANVLPSALPAEIQEQLYPHLPADNFRLTESRIEKEIAAEIEHYRLVLKKYKKARKAVHYSAVGLGAVAAALSSGAIAASLSGVGIVVGAPAAGVAASMGVAATSLTILNRKLDRKVDKHSRLHSLTIAKHDTINSSVSQALNDNCVSDPKFQLISREMQKYRDLKEALCANFAEKPVNSRPPDLEKIKDQILHDCLFPLDHLSHD